MNLVYVPSLQKNQFTIKNIMKKVIYFILIVLAITCAKQLPARPIPDTEKYLFQTTDNRSNEKTKGDIPKLLAVIGPYTFVILAMIFIINRSGRKNLIKHKR